MAKRGRKPRIAADVIRVFASSEAPEGERERLARESLYAFIAHWQYRRYTAAEIGGMLETAGVRLSLRSAQNLTAESTLYWAEQDRRERAAA